MVLASHVAAAAATVVVVVDNKRVRDRERDNSKLLKRGFVHSHKDKDKCGACCM